MKETINIVLELIKVRITVLVSITTVFGYLCAAGGFDAAMAAPVLGLFTLASGSAVLNQYQEFRTDALMGRTKNRPIPSGRITPEGALVFSLFLVLSGSAALFWSAGWTAFALGLLALIWYNGIYTPMKKKNAFAVVPGSVIGAIPPVVGWVAAGGSPFDPEILLIAFFLFMWQIPHFWLLLLMIDKDYEKAGIPTLMGIFTREQIGRLSFIWTGATALTTLMLPLFNIMNSFAITLVMLLAVLGLIAVSTRLLKSNPGRGVYRMAFHSINLFVLVIIVLVSIDKLIFV